MLCKFQWKLLLVPSGAIWTLPSYATYAKFHLLSAWCGQALQSSGKW